MKFEPINKTFEYVYGEDLGRITKSNGQLETFEERDKRWAKEAAEAGDKGWFNFYGEAGGQSSYQED